MDFTRYLRNKDGNIALVFSLGAGALFMAIDASIDMTKSVSDRSRAQSTADTASLWVAREIQEFSTNSEAISLGEDALAHNLTTEQMGQNIQSNFTVTEVEDDVFNVTVSLSGETKTALLSLFNRDTVPWTVSSTVTVSRAHDEIVLVADVSASMAGAKFADLKSALETFVTTVSPGKANGGQKTISLIPYAESVNFGSEYDSWLSSSNGYDYTADFSGCFIPPSASDFAADYASAIQPGDMQALPQRSDGSPGTCPSDPSKALLFSTDEDELIAAISGLELAYGTATDIGLLVGSRALTQKWRSEMSEGNNRPARITSKTNKFLILMTDGKPVRADQNTNGIMDAPENYSTPEARREYALENFIEVCEAVKSQGGVNLYTIGYDIAGATNADAVAALQNCVAGSGRYYDAETGDLEEIYSEIGAAISSLAISN